MNLHEKERIRTERFYLKIQLQKDIEITHAGLSEALRACEAHHFFAKPGFPNSTELGTTMDLVQKASRAFTLAVQKNYCFNCTKETIGDC